MKPEHLQRVRRRARLTQVQAAARLGVSQPYLSMLERGQRPLSPKLARRMMHVYGLDPTVLPPSSALPHADSSRLALDLAALGYPGFAYLRSRRRARNPAEVLLAALTHDNLEARVVEALPWVLVRYWDVDATWLVEQARLRNMQNRLGYVVHLARALAVRSKGGGEERNEALARLESALEESRLAREDTLCRDLPAPERRWLKKNRPAQARHWRLLTDLRPEHLRYAA